MLGFHENSLAAGDDLELNLEPVAPRKHSIRLAGGECAIGCSADQDVLNAALRAGVNWLRVGCRGGGCGVCRVIVHSGEYTAGKMSKRHVDPGENGPRYALACRVYPSSDLVVEPAPVIGRPASSPLT